MSRCGPVKLAGCGHRVQVVNAQAMPADRPTDTTAPRRRGVCFDVASYNGTTEAQRAGLARSLADALESVTGGRS